MNLIDKDLLIHIMCSKCNEETGFCVGKDSCMTMQIINLQPVIEE